MLKAVITNVAEWKSVLSAIGNIVEDAMFICNKDGITFRGMDAAHVALLDVSFPNRSFESFQADTSMFGIKIEDFKNVLTAASQNDKVALTINGKDKLCITITGAMNMNYNLKLLEGREVNTPVPKIVADSKIKISPTALTRVISNIEKVSEHVTIDSNTKRIQFSGKGDIGDAKIDVLKDNPELSTLEVKESSSSVYNIEYLTQLVRTIGHSCNNVGIEYGSQTPIKLLFEMPSMTQVNYYLAPRIEN
ncbi:MAG: proliferating cell nuclear antigen (pcna) [Cenarchaeum symbiont of Oopsacas minuta]|nr:proliferating cell nuclear antigen (pcna) [Cenarchaeum symbiont of Oopsacas minuta]